MLNSQRKCLVPNPAIRRWMLGNSDSQKTSSHPLSKQWTSGSGQNWGCPQAAGTTRSQSSRTCSSCPARRAKDSRPLTTVRPFPAAFPKLSVWVLSLICSRREFSQFSQATLKLNYDKLFFPTQEDVRLAQRQSAYHHIMRV